MAWGDFLSFDVRPTPTEEDRKRYEEETGKESSSISKAAPKTMTPKKFETNLDKELKKVLENLDFDKIPNKEEFDKKLKKIEKNIRKQIFTKSSALTKAVYNKAARKVSRELGKAYKPSKEDKETIDKLKTDPKKEDALEDLAKNTFSRAQEVITKAREDRTLKIDDIVKKLSEEMDKSKSDLRRIARTESTKISLGSRKTQYEKTGRFDEFKFKHIGIIDKRTGEDSIKMMELTKNGVSWGEYVKLAREVTKARDPSWTIDPDYPLLHPNQRSNFVRLV